MNTFGHNFRITIFGESHGEAVGVVVDGVRPGIAVSPEDFEADMARRRSGTAGTTPRSEKDTVHLLSGVYKGHTTGMPVTMVIYNKDTRPADYNRFVEHPRPSHADFTSHIKYEGYADPHGSGMFSGRMTAPLVAAGTIAKKMLTGADFHTRLVSVGECENPAKFEEIITEAAATGDSVGGVVETVVKGISAGTGEPFFDSVEATAAHLLFSIPAVKGVEFGAGFAGTAKRGSEYNDLITDTRGTTATNNDGGINGGMANGNPIVVRVAIKPAPSIRLPQETFNLLTGKPEELRIEGRHDVCIALRAAVVVEAAMAITLADLADRM